jgi:serine/threonine-protein kinase
LFFLLTGQPPYPGGGPADKMLAHCRAPIPSLLEVRRKACPRLAGDTCRVETDAVLTRLEAVFRRMVAKRPEDRHQSMAEVIAALTNCLPKRSRTARRHASSARA